jgi:putative membrane protein
MNRHIMFGAAAIAALSLAACGQKADETKGAATPAEQAATPDANPAATVPTPSDETKADVFAAKAADSDMFEIEAAKLAATRSTNPAVKKFAAMMEKAHTATSAELKSAIAASGVAITLPTALSEDAQGKLDDLTKADAKDFDKKYADGHGRRPPGGPEPAAALRPGRRHRRHQGLRRRHGSEGPGAPEHGRGPEEGLRHRRGRRQGQRQALRLGGH